MKKNLMILSAIFFTGIFLTSCAGQKPDNLRKAEQIEKAGNAFDELEGDARVKNPKDLTLETPSELKKTPLESSRNMELSPDRYLMATGMGQTDAEARRMAKAELSQIFESKIMSEVSSSTRSITGTKGDNFKKKVEADIRIISSVNLKGVIIGKTWKDDKTNTCYAQAALDRYKARDQWEGEIQRINDSMATQFNTLDQAQSQPAKLAPIRSILNLWLKKQSLKSRLKVIGFTDSDSSDFNMKRVFEMVPEIKSAMLISINISGDFSQEIINGISRSLTKEGFQLAQTQGGASILISGTVKTEPVHLDNPDWKFARATASISIVDLKSGAIIGKISKSVRKAKLSLREASRKSALALAKALSVQIIAYFGI